MKYSKTIAYILIIVGALNWGVYGVAGYDVVNILFGTVPVIARIIYVLVGLSAVYMILLKSTKSSCGCSCNSCACSSSEVQSCQIEDTK